MTSQLTPNSPNPLTGFTNSYLGWHFVAEDANDVFGGAIFLQEAGWGWQIFPNPANETLQQMSLTKQIGNGVQPQTVQFIVNDTDWFTLDGDFVRVLAQDDVDNNYTVASYTPPG